MTGRYDLGHTFAFGGQFGRGRIVINYYFIYGPQNGAGGYGETSLLPHNQLTIAQNFDLPFGHGRHYGSKISGPVDAVPGGSTLGSITTFYSGIPFSPTLENYGTGVQPSAGPNAPAPRLQGSSAGLQIRD